MIVNIQDDILKIHALGLLDKLLADKTTKRRIMWATNAYSFFGARYERNEEITPALVTGANSDVIKTRARKAMEQQSERTRQHAEVFTPLWICRMMNDHADEEWFGSKDVFSRDGAPTEKVLFPKRKSWKHYINSRRLEITCGEAPYLVSRYDVETGEAIPISERVGLLDRKLRVVGENAANEAEWLEWTVRAFWSIYGFEFQGDNVLIARVNLLMTFEEYLWERWKRKPTVKEYERLINIITWNIWQMDGLTGTIPYGTAEEEFQQFDLFRLQEMELEAEPKEKQPPCRVKNWLGGGNIAVYSALPGKGKHAMKFDFIIGNPPYQDETLGENKGYAPPIYHKFLESSYQLATAVELIHPARFLFNAGSTPKQWNQQMLADPHLKVLHYEQDAKNIFNNTQIIGGIAITYRDAGKTFGAIGTFTAYAELNSILQKVHQHPAFSNFSNIVVTRTAYRLTDKLHTDYPNAIHQLSSGHAYDMSTNIFERLPQVFSESEPNDDNEYARIIGREHGKRVYKFIRLDYINRVSNLFKYKIVLSKADGASGTIGNPVPARIMGAPSIETPGTGSTESFFSIGAFDTLGEAEYALKYVKTKFARTLLGVLKTTQDITPQKWEHVPLQDFTNHSDIDWTKSIPEIDRQLYKKYGLDKEEIAFIESHIKEME